jgi:hypothetical protein
MPKAKGKAQNIEKYILNFASISGFRILISQKDENCRTLVYVQYNVHCTVHAEC